MAKASIFASPAFHILSTARSILRENGLSLSLTREEDKPLFMAMESQPIFSQLRSQILGAPIKLFAKVIFDFGFAIGRAFLCK